MDNDKRATWERYAAAWKATTREAKQAALATSTAATVTYRDPLVVAEGHAALVDYMIRGRRRATRARCCASQAW